MSQATRFDENMQKKLCSFSHRANIVRFRGFNMQTKNFLCTPPLCPPANLSADLDSERPASVRVSMYGLASKELLSFFSPCCGRPALAKRTPSPENPCPPNLGGEDLQPPKLRWANRQSPVASVQRTRPTLASHSAVPCGTNVKRMNANRGIRIAAQRTQGVRRLLSVFRGEI